MSTATANAACHDRPRFGLLAGWGRYPIVVAEALVRQGFDVYCIGLKDHADRQRLTAICRDYREMGLGKLGRQIRYFRRHGVQRATMVGKVHKVTMFQPFYLLKHFPDWRTARVCFPIWIRGKKNRTDDTLLTAVVDTFAADGVAFVPATDFVPELLVNKGQLCGRRLSSGQRHDIEFGWTMAKKMGGLDVGQSVVVKNRTVLAVEAVEGTDQCIRRAGQLCPAGGFTVVKVAKPQQDMRFDVPTIGLGTLQTMVESGARTLAVEADKTVLLDQDAVIHFAERNGLTIIALEQGPVAELADAA